MSKLRVTKNAKTNPDGWARTTTTKICENEIRATGNWEQEIVMTITLTPDIEQALAEESRETGINPEQLAVERLRTSLALQDPPEQLPGPTLAELAQMDRVSRIHAIKGSMAYLGPSRLIEERPAEIAREERRWSK